MRRVVVAMQCHRRAPVAARVKQYHAMRCGEMLDLMLEHLAGEGPARHEDQRRSLAVLLVVEFDAWFDFDVGARIVVSCHRV